MKKTLLILLITFVLCSCGKTDNKIRSQKETDIAAQKQENDAVSEMVPEEASSESAVLSESEELPVTQDENTVNVPALQESSSLEGKIIVVDAGHGLFSKSSTEPVAPGSSETKAAFVSGTRGANQTEEELNLAVALKLKAALEKKGAVVHMTRDTHETTRSNVDRAKFANELNADISVKIHADGNDNPSAHGVSMLVPGNKHIKNTDVVQKSRYAGELVLEEYVKTTGAKNNGISVRDDMTGFNWSEVPVILLEMGFMTNPEEDKLMETEAYRDKIVEGTVSGLERYFE